jgi:hypothetical protein
MIATSGDVYASQEIHGHIALTEQIPSPASHDAINA